MWPTRAVQLAKIDRGLAEFSMNITPLAGVQDPAARHALAMQMIASCRRLDYTASLKKRDIDARRADPTSELFDPERAALWHARNGDFDEAIWHVFLSVHFGKHRRHGWRMLKDVYSGLGTGFWTWKRVSANPTAFRAWLKSNRKRIGGSFGNHRKYETLNVESGASSHRVIESFVQLCSPSPSQYFAGLARATGNDPRAVFDAAYRGLSIARFGRLAKFDFLALLGRMDLAPLEPGSPYLRQATGPLRGARLLVDGNPKSARRAEDAEAIVTQLGHNLGLGMQVMEDSICNWQKSPTKFVHFKG